MIPQQKIPYKNVNASYFHSFMIAFGVIVFGFTLQLFFGSINISFVRFPANLFILILLVTAILVGHFKYKQRVIVQWLSSAKAAIASIVGFSVVSLLMGFITQGETANLLVRHLGLNNIAFSWTYVLSLLLLIITLGFATVKRIYPFRKQNFWYILNHLGLWITLIAANFGFADQMHLRMKISTSTYSKFAYDENGGFQELPFAIKQTHFKLENYTPKLTIIDNKTSMLSMKSGKNTIEAKQNASLKIENWVVTVLKSYNSARALKNNIVPFDTIGTAPAAFVRAENTLTKQTKQGWVSCGNYLIGNLSIALDNSHSLIMLLPTTKEMVLGIEIKKKNTHSEGTIAVNSPQTVDGWKMYIVNYYEEKGKYSDSTIIELIKDSWQPLVYVGLGMMVLGSFFVFWRGKK
jgi:hypothetical protein